MVHRADAIWRLKLPDDWEPTGYQCVTLQIPAGEQYLHAFSAAVGLLTIQKTWARDDTRTGAKTVAKTWENALYIMPWSVSDTCAVIAVPPITNQDDADDAAAAVILQFFVPIIHTINTLAPTSAGCSTAVDAVMADLADYGADSATRGQLERLCADLNELPPADRLNYELGCPQIDQWEDLRNKIKDNPLDWLNKLSEWLLGWVDSTTDKIFESINTVSGLLGGANIFNFIAHHGGITPGGGAGFGTDCEWEHTFDFTTGDHGWFLFTGNGCTEGIRTGLGVESFPGCDTNCCDPGDEFMSGFYWNCPEIGDVNVTYFSADYHWQTGDETSGAIVIGFGPFIGYHRPPEGDSVEVWTGAATINTFVIGARCAYHPPADLGDPGSAILRSVTMRGPGTVDPYSGL